MINTEIRTIHTLNLGCGVQSTRLVLEFEAGEIKDSAGNPIVLDAAFFADTQDEPGAVYRHLEWLQRTVKNFPIHVRTKGRLSDHLKNGTNSTGHRFASIPAFTKNQGSVGQIQRQCSKEYKIQVIEQSIRRELLSLPPGRAVPAGFRVIQYFGISIEECGRAIRIMRNRVSAKFKKQAEQWGYLDLLQHFSTRRWAFGFPLADRFLTRAHCDEFNQGRVPHKVPRSACVYCPYHDDDEWLAIQQEPEDWALAVDVDEALRISGNVVNRNMDSPMYLHRSLQPLVQVTFNTKGNPKKRQLQMNFSSECLGVCGV